VIERTFSSSRVSFCSSLFSTPTSRVSIHISLGVVFWEWEEIFTALDLVRLASLNSCLFDCRISWAICSTFARLSPDSTFMKECCSLLFYPILACCLLRIAGISGYGISLLFSSSRVILRITSSCTPASPSEICMSRFLCAGYSCAVIGIWFSSYRLRVGFYSS